MMNRRPIVKGVIGLGLLEILGLKKAAAVDQNDVKSTPMISWPPGAVAQLIGANAVSSMFDPGYGLERHLPSLIGPGPRGNPPKSFRTVGGGSGKFHPMGRFWFDERYLRWLATSFSIVVSYYGQNVEGFNMFMWNGVRMNGLTIFAGFTAERTEAEAREIWATAYRQYGLTSKPALTLASGNSGWTTLETAWNTIASPDAKVIWLATTDSPSYPKDEEPNEAAVLLMVAHPAYDAGRKPLAFFSAPQVVPLKEAKREEGETPRIAALRQSVERVCAAAGIEPKSIASLATDCGRGNPAAAQRLSEVAASVHELMPDVDVLADRIDMAALLGELGANTVNYTLLLAAYAAHQRNHPVLYLSNVDPDAARAMLVFPPRDHTPPDPHRPFREHHARGQWYAPWWGQRLDGKKDY